MDSGARTNGPVFRLVAVLAAPIVIDLITMGVLPVMELPADGVFSVIGDTAAGFSPRFGVEVVGCVPSGVILHCLIVLALGVFFGVAVTRSDSFLSCTRYGASYLGQLLATGYVRHTIVSRPSRRGGNAE